MNKIDLNIIINKIKKILSNEDGIKILDKDVAKNLEIKSEHFATMKKRKKVPFEKIAIFCNKRNIIINEILFD